MDIKIIMNIEVSIGEVVDKITILQIKLVEIKDKDKLINIQKEHDKLIEAFPKYSEVKLLQQLYAANLELWQLEDKIRNKEKIKLFDREFITAARNIYKTNDIRSELKRQINIEYKSDIIEEKGYAKYE